MPLRVLLLTGSPVDAFNAELSLLYARGCHEALTADPRYEVRVAHVTPCGCWRFPAGLSPAAVHAAEPMPVTAALPVLAVLGAAVALPQMFCRPGMTSYRGLLEVLGIPYVGNTPGLMALTADKAATRTLVAAAGVVLPYAEVLRPGDRPSRTPPVVVKPVDADNSHGTTLVRDPDAYDEALDAAFTHSPAVLVEDYVELGREVRAGVLAYGDELVCLPLEEYAIDAGRGIRGYTDKIIDGEDGALGFAAKTGSRSWIVDEADPITTSVQRAALACHRALGCRDYGLFDFRVDPAGRPWFLEAGLYCSFSPDSVLVAMAAAAGITLPGLLATAIDQAIHRGIA